MNEKIAVVNDKMTKMNTKAIEENKLLKAEFAKQFEHKDKLHL